MKKLIFRNIYGDITSFFLITALSITLVVWVIQAVNFLDFVSEDGHSFKVYFMYSLLNLPKIFSRLIIFVFFISLFYIFSKYEDNKEILIFWTNGIKKIEFINHLIKFSFLFLILQLVLNFLVVPKTQDLARSYIRDSNIDYLPSLIKSKQFIDTVSDLTIFVEKKEDNGILKNIFLKEFLLNGDLNNNPQLTDGDKVFVPFIDITPQQQKDYVEYDNANKVLVTGFVFRPGAHYFRPGYNVKDYIALSGGASDVGSAKRVKILKKDGTTSMLAYNKIVEPGDIIEVPETYGSILFGNTGFIQAVTSIATLMLAYRAATQ